MRMNDTLLSHQKKIIFLRTHSYLEELLLISWLRVVAVLSIEGCRNLKIYIGYKFM